MARFGLVLTVAALLAALLASGSPAQAQAAVPAAPTGLTAPTVAHDSVTLSWDDPGDSSITGYRILRRDPINQAPGTFSTVEPDTGSAETTYTDNSVNAGTRYVYRVKAINSAGTSGQSNYVNVETPAAPPPSPPAAPTGLTASLNVPRQRHPQLGRPRRRLHHGIPGAQALPRRVGVRGRSGAPPGSW